MQVRAPTVAAALGFIGLVIAVIFTAAMSSSSGELNALATVSVMDIYRRHFRPQATDRHYLLASRIFTGLWGLWAVIFAQYAKNLGSLVEAVNLAIRLERPLLLKGEPGCGKTRLAGVVAAELDLPYEPWYIKSTSRARDARFGR